MKNVFYRMRKSKALAVLLAVSMVPAPVYATECIHGNLREWKETISRTCTTPGVAVRTCVDCGKTIETKEIPSLGGHQLSEWTVETPATCGDYGKKVQKCEISDCDWKEEQSIEPLGHHMVEVDKKNPTCTEDGYVLRKCDRSQCGVEEETVLLADPANHKFVDGEIIKKPTCETTGSQATKCEYCGTAGETKTLSAKGGTCYWLFDAANQKYATCKEDGYKTYVCMSCGNEKVETISKDTVPHSPADDYIKKEATCKEEGLYATKCTVCGNANADRVIPMIQCSMEDVPELAVPASCNKDGYRVSRCNVCGKEEKLTIAAETVPHAWIDDYVKYETTCQKPGLMITKCSSCGKEGMREIPEAHNYSETGRTPASCYTDGVAEFKCDTCGTTKSEVLNAIGSHDWIIASEKDATCAEAGEMTYKCSVCGELKHETEDATGKHDWECISNKKATCSKQGIKKFECTVCGEMKTKATKATGKHNWKQEASALATCSENGFIKYGCTSCNKDKTTTLPATGAHNYGEWIVKKEAVQTAAGEMQCECEYCGYTLTRTIEPELQEEEIVDEKEVETAEEVMEEVADEMTDELTESIETVTGTAEQNTEMLIQEFNEDCCQHIAGEYGAYELVFCEEHQIFSEMQNTLMENAETEAERVKVLKQMQSMLKIEAEYMYDEWIAQSEGEAQELAVTAKAVFEVNFHTQFATWNLMYGENSEETLIRTNELLYSQCVDLCILTEGLN